MKYTFTQPQGIIIFKHLISVFPVGVNMLTYFSSKGKSGLQIFKYEYKNEKITETEIIDDDILQSIYKLRAHRKTDYSWVLNEEFRESNFSEKKAVYQLKINDETQHSTLLMRFRSPYDEDDDVIYISLGDEMKFFGLDGGEIKLITHTKTVFAKTLHKNISEIIKSEAKNLKKHLSFLDQVRASLDISQKKEDETDYYKEKYETVLLDIAKRIIHDFSKKHDVDIVLTTKSENKIKQYTGDISVLENIILKASGTTYDINSFSGKNFITLEPEYIIFPDYNIIQPELKHENEIILSKENSDYKITGKLKEIEKAVRKLSANNEKIIGKNVGKAMVPPITAPAITEFLSKHRDKIIKIISDNPTLCSEAVDKFKSLNNILPHNFLSKIS
ncbi:MAG: hypothetical protein LBQ22_10935 [Bacteroidales bacterium]|jgi:hypothetical protein|nr:hypothetical protein [Bacteroidales bacterium]